MDYRAVPELSRIYKMAHTKLETEVFGLISRLDLAGETMATETMVIELGACETSIRRALKSLEKAGIIQKTGIKKTLEGYGGHNIWKVNPTSKWVSSVNVPTGNFSNRVYTDTKAKLAKAIDSECNEESIAYNEFIDKSDWLYGYIKPQKPKGLSEIVENLNQAFEEEFIEESNLIQVKTLVSPDTSSEVSSFRDTANINPEGVSVNSGISASQEVSVISEFDTWKSKYAPHLSDLVAKMIYDSPRDRSRQESERLY